MTSEGIHIILKKVVLVSLVLFFSGCATKQDFILFQGGMAKEGQSVYVQPSIVEYKIAPRDKLSIMVFNHPELSTRTNAVIATAEKGISVSSDGTVPLALVGRVKVAGLTKEEASDLIQKRYAQYIKEPNVNVEILNQRIYVVGEVNKPGVVPLANESMTVIEAIAQAGDFNVYSQRTQVKVMRGDMANNPTISTIDMTKLASLNTRDLMLYSGDVVYVEPNSMRATNVNINEYLPALQLINSLITPFVNIKYLTK